MAQQEPGVRTDALTGVQALERKAPGLPLAPGKVERWEFAYIWHGICACILSRNVVTGQRVAPYCGATRTEAACPTHVQAVVVSDPSVRWWHFVVDNLAIHRAASRVRVVTAESKLELGEKGTRGMLANRQARAAFLSDPSHRLLFHCTPKHMSWMNQIEIWLSLLVRRLLKRGSFPSVADLKSKILAFIDYDNRTMAKPFTWMYQGTVLAA